MTWPFRHRYAARMSSGAPSRHAFCVQSVSAPQSGHGAVRLIVFSIAVWEVTPSSQPFDSDLLVLDPAARVMRLQLDAASLNALQALVLEHRLAVDADQ